MTDATQGLLIGGTSFFSTAQHTAKGKRPMTNNSSDTILSAQIFALGLAIIGGAAWTTLTVLSQITTSF